MGGENIDRPPLLAGHLKQMIHRQLGRRRRRGRRIRLGPVQIENERHRRVAARARKDVAAACLDHLGAPVEHLILVVLIIDHLQPFFIRSRLGKIFHPSGGLGERARRIGDVGARCLQSVLESVARLNGALLCDMHARKHPRVHGARRREDRGDQLGERVVAVGHVRLALGQGKHDAPHG